MQQTPSRPSVSSTFVPLIAFAAIGVAVLRFIAADAGIERLWGLDYLREAGRFHAALWTLLCVLPALALLSPALRGRLAAALPSLSRWLPLTLALAFLAAAALYPMRTFFYGDGGPLVAQIWRLAMKEPVDAALLFNWKSSPLAGALLYGFAVAVPHAQHLLSLPMPTHPLYPFVAQSLAALLLLAVYAYRKRGDSRLAPQFLLLFGTAGALFFFGYAEFYLPVFLFLFFYLRFAEQALEGAPLWPAALALAAAIASLYAAVLLLPSLLFIALRRSERHATAATTRNALFLLLGAAGLYLALLFAGMIGAADSRVFMPLHPVTTAAGTCAYTMFSRWHLADLANLLALLVPLPLLVLLIVVATRHGRAFLKDPLFGFHLLATGFFLLFVFGANTSLGLARDWDLTAPLGLLLGFFALAALKRAERGDALFSATALGVLTLFVTLPWIATMRSADSAAARFERVMALDETHMYPDYAQSGYEALRKYHRNAGNAEKDLQLSRKKIEIIDYPSNYVLLIGKSAGLLPRRPAAYLDEQKWMLGRLRSRAQALRMGGLSRDYAISVSQIDSLGELIAVTAFLGHQDSALVESLTALGEATGTPYPYPSILGMRAFLERRFSDAAELLQRAIDRGFHHPRVYLTLGTALGILQRYSESLAAYEAGVRANPDNGPLLVTLAKYLLRARIRTEDAMLLLGRAAELNPAPEAAREIRALLEQAQAAGR